MARTPPARWTAILLGLGLAGAMPGAGWCLEAGAVAAPPGAVARGAAARGAEGRPARGLALDLRLGHGPLGDPAPGRLDARPEADLPAAPLDISRHDRYGPVGYGYGIGSSHAIGIEDGSPTGARRFTLSGEVAYEDAHLPRLGLRGGLGNWAAGQPSLGALDVGNAWAFEGTVDLGRLIGQSGRDEDFSAVVRFGASSYHGDAAPDQPRGIDLRFGIGARFRF